MAEEGLRPISSLDWRGTDEDPGSDLIVRGARVLDPRTGVDGVHDIVVRGGEVAELTGPARGRPRAPR